MKRHLDASALESYRSVSNLPFISKVSEKVDFKQMNAVSSQAPISIIAQKLAL